MCFYSDSIVREKRTFKCFFVRESGAVRFRNVIRRAICTKNLRFFIDTNEASWSMNGSLESESRPFFRKWNGSSTPAANAESFFGSQREHSFTLYNYERTNSKKKRWTNETGLQEKKAIKRARSKILSVALGICLGTYGFLYTYVSHDMLLLDFEHSQWNFYLFRKRKRRKNRFLCTSKSHLTLGWILDSNRKIFLSITIQIANVFCHSFSYFQILCKIVPFLQKRSIFKSLHCTLFQAPKWVVWAAVSCYFLESRFSCRRWSYLFDVKIPHLRRAW